MERSENVHRMTRRLATFPGSCQVGLLQARWYMAHPTKKENLKVLARSTRWHIQPPHSPGSKSRGTLPSCKSEATCLRENQKESLFRSTRREFRLRWRIGLELVAIDVVWHTHSANMDAHEKGLFRMNRKKSGHGVG
jgi:hypothetical protein